MTEVGVPDALITDGSGEEKSSNLRQFCNEVGSTLRILERMISWANKAELYIGLIKEVVKKDMINSFSVLVFEAYSLKRKVHINNLIV